MAFPIGIRNSELGLSKKDLIEWLDYAEPRIGAIPIFGAGDVSSIGTRTVGALTKWAAGTPGVAATGLLTFGTNPDPADIIAINGVGFTYVASGAAGNQINIGATPTITASNTATVLNASTDPLVNIATYTPATNHTGITHDTAGTVGNTFTLSASGSHIVASGPTLSGGIDLILEPLTSATLGTDYAGITYNNAFIGHQSIGIGDAAGAGGGIFGTIEQALAVNAEFRSGTTKMVRAGYFFTRAEDTAIISGALFGTGPDAVNKIVGTYSQAWADDDVIVDWTIGAIAIGSNHNSSGNNLTHTPNLAAIWAEVDVPRPVLNGYGLLITAANGTNASHGYGIRIDGVSSSADPFGIYISGSWPNYFGGSVTVADTLQSSDIETLTITTGLLSVIQNGVAANTSSEGIHMENVTPATSGQQQYSPAITLLGSGWNTASGGDFETDGWKIENRPVQGTTHSTSKLAFASSINEGAYADAFLITDTGIITVATWNGVVIGAQFGGTGQSSYTVGDLVYASASTTLSKLPDVSVGSYLRSGGTATAPLWSTTTLPNSAAVGDLLYASGTNIYSNLADVATGNALISGGVTTAMSWGKIGLTTHVSGTLPVTNGGTGTATAFTAGSVVFAGASGIYSQDNANLFYNSSAQVLSIGTSAPTVRFAQHFASASTADYGGMVLSTWSAGNADHSTILDLKRSRSSSINTYTIIQNNDTIAYIAFRGSDGTTFQNAAYIKVSVDGVPASTSVPGRFIIATTPVGSTNPVENFRIDSVGNVGIGSTSPRKKLDILSNSQTQLRLTYTDNSVYCDLTVGSGGTLTVAPTGSFNFNTTGKQVDPTTNYDQNLGQLSKKYLSLHAAELWVETLVAQNTIATIGGRILVGPTTVLTSDLAPGATSIIVKHNQMTSGDRVYMEANGLVEFMAITSAPSGSGPYTYTVTRDLDGTGANQWYAGDAVFNTGQTGTGAFIDIYSVRGANPATTTAGPTIVGNVRTSSTYNAWIEHWAIGNLKGTYGYGVDTFGVGFGQYDASKTHITIDTTNGYRTFNGLSTVVQQIDNSGNITVGQVAGSQSNVFISAAGAISIRNNTTNRINMTAAGVMTINDSAGTAKITLDASAGMTLDGKLQMFGASSAIAIGSIPPTSGTVGTGIWIDRTAIIGLQSNKQTFILNATNGNIGAGSDLSAAATVAFNIFGSAGQTYNSEAMGAGDLLIGDNSTSKANIHWKLSTGKLEFRGGTTVQAFIDTTGAIVAGAGAVTLNAASGVVATLGTIGGWALASTTITGTNLVLDSAGIIRANATAVLTTDGWYMDYNIGTPRFRIGTVTAGALTKGIYWNGANLQIIGTNFTLDTSGNITATGGTIGGWTILSGSISSTGVVLASGATAYISFGATPPTSSTTNSGTFNDATGFYGIKSAKQTFAFTATDGVIKIGSDLSAAATTAFLVAGTAITYNSESLGAGDILIGDNTTGTTKANVRWKKSTGQLEFRGGTTIKAYVDTDGSIKAGGGDVLINDLGISIYGGITNSGPSKAYKVYDSTGANLRLSITDEETVTGLDHISTFYALPLSGKNTFVDMEAKAVNAKTAQIFLATRNSTSGDYLSSISLDHSTTNQGTMTFKVGTAGGASTCLSFAATGKSTFTNDMTIVGDLLPGGVIKAGSGPTTLTDAAGKILAIALNTVGVGQGGTGLTVPGTSGNVLTSNGSAWISSAPGAGMAIGGTVTSGTTGSILFVGASAALTQDNANLFWDDTNNILKVSRPSISTTSSDGFVLFNNTGATQYSPRIRLSGNNGSSQVLDWIVETIPNGATNSLLGFSSRTDTESYLQVVSFLYNGASGNVGLNFNSPSGANANMIYQANAVNKWYVRNVGSDDHYSIINSDANGNTEYFKIVQAGTVTMAKYTTGNAIFDASGNISSFSDARLKDKVRDFNLGLEALMRIKPAKVFHWNQLSGMDQKGEYVSWFAQDLLDVVPHAIGNVLSASTGKGYYSLSDRPILATAINAIQEQQKQIVVLTQRIQELESQLDKGESNDFVSESN